MKPPKVSVIIPHYSIDKSYLHLCIDSLTKQTYPNVEIIISSSSEEVPVGLHPVAKLYQTTKRMHYAEAINKGVELALSGKEPPKYLILGNDDTIYSKDAILGLVQMAGESELILNPLSNCDNGILFHKHLELKSGHKSLVLKNQMSLDEIKGFETDLLNLPLGDALLIPSKLNFVCFYCTLIPVSVWQKVGSLDERFATAGYEDSDYCFRAAEHNIGSWITTRSFVFHFSGKTSSSVTTDEERRENERKFREKWESRVK